MIITCLLAILMLLVLYFDGTRYLIPNWLVGIVLALYPVHFYLSPTPLDWQAGLVAAIVAFIIGFALFDFKIMGGGDVKLLTVCFLWVAPNATLTFCIYVGLLGGALTLALMTLRPTIGYAIGKIGGENAKVPRVFTYKEPIPYGIAIGIGFLALLWQEMIPGLSFR